MSRFGKTIILAVISLLAGSIYLWLADEVIDLSTAIILMGIPSGWRFTGSHIGRYFKFDSILFMAIGFVMKLLLCFLIGWIVFLLDLILCVIEICTGKEII